MSENILKLERNGNKLFNKKIDKMSIPKIFLLTTLLIFAMVFSAPHASAISLSIGDPVEIFNLWKSVRDQLNSDYRQLQQDISEEKAVEAQVNSVFALIKRLDTLSEKFSTIIDISNQNKITVIYPNGGETLECDKNHVITWDIEIAPNQTPIDSLANPTFGIYLSAKDEFGGRYIVDAIVDELTTKNKKYNWIVPCDTRSGSYFITIRANPDLKIASFEDSSNASFSIISTMADAAINSISAGKINVISGENININWSGSNVSEYKLYFGTEFGTGASMNGKDVSAQLVSMGLQTSASFSYTNITDTPKKVYVLLEAYGTRENRDSFKQIEITINPKE